MADYETDFPGDLNLPSLLVALRQREELLFELLSIKSNPATGDNHCSFRSLLFDPNPPPPDNPKFLNAKEYPEATDDAARALAKSEFLDLGGEIILDPVILINQQPTYVIFCRGLLPEFPRAHEPSPPTPPPISLPQHAQPTFAAGGPLSGIDWDRASNVPMSLDGLLKEEITVFKDADTGNIEAFLMITDADIDTDGPGGSKEEDPDWGSGTSLQYPKRGGSCNSHNFPGVVRSVKLRNAPFGLLLGDFVYICYNGQVVACQVYDQGPDEKIGEISLYAAKQVGLIPPGMSDHEAAIGGNRTKELVTLCFPGSGNQRALPNADIVTKTQNCFAAFIGKMPNLSSVPATAAHAIAVAPPAPVAGALNIYQRSTWGALKPKVSSFAPSPAKGIVLHNTEDKNRNPQATLREEIDVSFDLSRRIQKSHMFHRGWSDIGQHFTISRGGIIMEARAGTLDAAANAQVVQGAHAGVNLYNRQWWGIELEGDYRQDGAMPTPAQTTALFALCRWLSGKIPGFNPAQQAMVHRQVKPGGTDCPGHLYIPGSSKDYLSDVRGYLAANPGPGPDPTIA